VPYFTDVLQHLAPGQVASVDDLLPHRWHARHPDTHAPVDLT
jgi:hypothetical protein